MKAPDKICIGISPSKVGEGLVYTTVSKEYPYAKEYIRKDTLLEWAREKYNKAYKLHLKKGDNYSYGQGKMDAYQKLIDKLNSM